MSTIFLIFYYKMLYVLIPQSVLKITVLAFMKKVFFSFFG